MPWMLAFLDFQKRRKENQREREREREIGGGGREKGTEARSGRPTRSKTRYLTGE
jgi:hypothetical protein